MKAIWTSHLRTPEERKQFADLINNNLSKAVIDRLNTILDQEIETAELQTMDQRSYSVPNWSEYQAHLNGYKEATKFIKDLFDL